MGGPDGCGGTIGPRIVGAMLDPAIRDLASTGQNFATIGFHLLNGQIGSQARASIDALSVRYTGHEYGNPIQSERVVLRIVPERQRSNGL